MSFQTEDINNVLLFKTGEFNGVKTTLDDLKNIIIATKELGNKFKPRLKITHKTEEEHSKDNILKDLPFKFGEIENLKLIDNALYGDFKKVPKKIADLYKNGLLSSVSAEIIHNLKTNSGKIYKRVLDSVALLGHEREALWEVLKDYSLGTSNTNNFVYEKVFIYQYQKEENFMQISEKDYLEKTKKYFEKGLEVLSYEEFLILDDSEKETYFEELETSFLEIENQEKKADDIKTPKVKKLDEKAKEEIKNLVLELFKNISKDLVENKPKEEIENNEPIKEETIEENEDKKFVYSLTRNVKEPRLPIAFENRLLEVLKNSSMTKQVFKYSFQGNVKKASLKDQIKDLLVSLPPRKDFSLDEIAKVTYGISINSKEMKDFEGADPESIIKHKKVENYALKHSLPLQTEKDYFSILNIIETKEI